MEVMPGTSDDGIKAGDGYSGGGGFCMNARDTCLGGSGGGDGVDGPCEWCTQGGHGSGEDLSRFQLKHFQLTPGAGGQSYEDLGVFCGGGGGGVLVNGQGPEASPYQ